MSHPQIHTLYAWGPMGKLASLMCFADVFSLYINYTGNTYINQGSSENSSQ